MEGRFTIRSYRPGDEREITRLYAERTARLVGPFGMTPESWLAERREGWRSPGLEADPEHVRVAEREGRIVGYMVADHRESEYSQVQDLGVADGEDADTVAAALLEDVERIARARGRLVVLLELPDDDDLVVRASGACGYEFRPGGAVFMALITDLAKVLVELKPELERRLAESELRDWRGEITLRSAELTAGLRIAGGTVDVAAAEEPVIAVEVSAERLPLLLLGRTTVTECYLQDELAVDAADRETALRLLDVLFPRVPIFLPRGQWW